MPVVMPTLCLLNCMINQTFKCLQDLDEIPSGLFYNVVKLETV